MAVIASIEEPVMIEKIVRTGISMQGRFFETQKPEL
jgi:hypothetical protein